MIFKTVLTAIFMSSTITLSALSLFDSGNYKDGSFFGVFSFGNMTALGCLAMLHFRILSVSNTFSFFLFISTALSVVLFLLLWLIQSFVSSSILFLTIDEILLSPQLYIFLCIVTVLGVIEYLWIKIEFYSFNGNFDLSETVLTGQKESQNPNLDNRSEKSFNQDLPVSIKEDSMIDDYRDSEDSED